MGSVLAEAREVMDETDSTWKTGRIAWRSARQLLHMRDDAAGLHGGGKEE